ncbi:unnamed protein product [Ceratitis capitata]|uniref:(Mediterranean fruit fly) hypothetical protein n=1 Tax=Ceratitis capitata TaxID=7213 RepID=A0A811UQV7_CERCA|nr:unnamed protein product [Ceratitis capitata]
MLAGRQAAVTLLKSQQLTVTPPPPVPPAPPAQPTSPTNQACSRLLQLVHQLCGRAFSNAPPSLLICRTKAFVSSQNAKTHNRYNTQQNRQAVTVHIGDVGAASHDCKLCKCLCTPHKLYESNGVVLCGMWQK